MPATPEILPVGWLTAYPSREAWMADRRSAAPDCSLGATDCAAILGHGYASPWDVWLTARGDAPPKADTPDLARGRRWESRVREDYQEATGYRVEAPLCRAQHPDLPWLRPSPDAFAFDPDSQRWGGLECKTARSSDGWGEDGTVLSGYPDGAEDVVPPGYALQCLALLAATGLPWWDLAVAIPSRGAFMELRTIRIVADPELQADLVGKVGDWRERHLVQGEEPLVDASDALGAHLARRFPGRGDKTLRLATLDEVAQMDEYVKLGQEIDEREEKRKIAKHALLLALGDGYGLRRDSDAKGARLLAVRSAGRRTLSLGDVEKQAPDLAQTLAERGLVKTGAPSTSLRAYDYK